MPFNGTGTYAPAGADFPVVTLTVIASAKYNNVVTDQSTALSNCVTRDGQSPWTSNLPAGGFKITGMAAGSARTDSARIGDVQDGLAQWIVAAGTADALTAAYSPAITALVDGQTVGVRTISSNATTTPTFSPNGLTARTITQAGGKALPINSWNNLTEMLLRYNLANTRWELVSVAPIPAAIGTAKGDIVGYSASGVPARVAVGTDGTLLAADSSNANGVAWTGAGFTTGDVKLTIKTVADTGWVLMNDTTIGNAASGATGRANADTVNLFLLLWNNTANADCAVSTGRGANAAVDYASNKTIALPKALGRALANYGTGSGLTARTMGQVLGEETHIITTAESAAHDHAGMATILISDNAGANQGLAPRVTNSVGGNIGLSVSVSGLTSVGGGTGHNTMQPTLFLNTMIKL